MCESRRLALRALCVLALPLVGLVELGLHLWFASRAPSFDEYRVLTEEVAALRVEGDLVVVEPAWAEPLVFGAVPVATREAARPDLDGYGGAVEVSLFGDRAGPTSSWPLQSQRRAGPFTLRRLANPSPHPSAFDFVDALGPDRVEVAFAGETCPWVTDALVVAGGLGGHPTFPAARFACGGQPWFNVSETVVADERFRPRRCLWAHPPAQGALEIRYRDVVLGDRLVGHGGMYWIIERERRGAPIRLAIEVEGDRLAEVIHRDGDGWSRFEVPLGRFAGRRGVTVTFAVSSDDYRDRHFCFEARSQ